MMRTLPNKAAQLLTVSILLFLLPVSSYAWEPKADDLDRTAAARAAEVVEIAVDAGKPGPAISPYVYGQFIEHLGRCIRDGIWAEKLVDRKFLQEPGKNWEPIQPAGVACNVFLDTAGAYAAPHAMAIWVRDAQGGRCGIRQGHIGLLRGKEYVGYAVLAHAGAPAPVEVRLEWGSGPDQGQSVVLTDVRHSYRRFAFRFHAGDTTDSASLSLTLSSPGYLWAAGLSLMPADNVHGMRADTIALLRTLNAPIYRWPGGNFVSGYNWKDALGDRDRRPPRWSRAWKDVEENDFGIDEFVNFCREIKTEPLVVVNTGLGGAAEAAEEVEYANGSVQTRGGALRAQNGHSEPYRVTWWGVGNEMYGNWQLGNVPADRYALRHNAFAAAMRAADPQIKLIGVGACGKWNDLIVPACAGHMDLLSMHHYGDRKFRTPMSPADAAAYEADFLKYSDCVAAGVRNIVDDLRRRQNGPDAAVRALRLCIDEWGLVRDWNPTPDGPGTGPFEHYYTIGDAVTVGRALHELLRAADRVGMATWPQAVNVIGAIKTSHNHAAMDPVGHLLTLYRRSVNGQVLPTIASAGSTIDAVAARDRGTGVLSLGLINFSPKENVTIRLKISGATGLQAASVWRIAGPELGSSNVPGEPEAVTLAKLPGPVVAGKPIVLPAHSISVLTIPCEE
jgi:alpha-N-arabinofuranosidase